ncbi:unnamed protein product [Pneumocystis jirovecii]|uniref:Uncharacterized protein n=1 Tax=Pneumocystis jirovecii TaxID=42068 RepID=L0PBS0_PNEJI|nr:unnamed protein product [Pneumocystis jirovecii]
MTYPIDKQKIQQKFEFKSIYTADQGDISSVALTKELFNGRRIDKALLRRKIVINTPLSSKDIECVLNNFNKSGLYVFSGYSIIRLITRICERASAIKNKLFSLGFLASISEQLTY